MIESVQVRMTGMVDGWQFILLLCRGKEYEERLKVLKLTTLEIKATRADRPMFQVYKIMMGIESANKGDLFKIDEGSGWGPSMKLFRKRVTVRVTASVTVGCVTSETNCQLLLYRPCPKA